MCWLPGLRKNPCGARFVAGSGSCASAELSGHVLWLLESICCGCMTDSVWSVLVY